MTRDQFRRLALSFGGAVEGAHMGHPDFRVNNKIFATLQIDKRFAMVKLTPDQQKAFITDAPEAFLLESGAWGRAGCTRVILSEADAETVGEALTLAWQGVQAAAKAPTKRRRKRDT
jgi:hypothetical protein